MGAAVGWVGPECLDPAFEDSGERRITREQLAAESSQVITSQDLRGAVADRRYRSRKIAGLDAATGRALVQLQSELAFHREFETRRAGDADNDAPVLAIRGLIGRLRAGAAQQ